MVRSIIAISSVSSVSSIGGDYGISGIEESEYSGYWSAAYVLTGHDMLILYSTSEEFLEESSPLLILPIPTANYQNDLIQLGLKGQHATPDLLMGRDVHQSCG